MAKKRARTLSVTETRVKKRAQSERIQRKYPREPLETAIKIPFVIKEKNGGNPWTPDEIAGALDIGVKTVRFFYVAAASRDFGFTEGGRDSERISLTDQGRDLVNASSKDAEDQIKRKAFLSIDVFRKVLEYYKGSKLPEMKYLRNTLEREFGLRPETHEEFSRLFGQNCDYVGMGEGLSETNGSPSGSEKIPEIRGSQSRETLTVAEPEKATGLRCFVIMPFRERDANRPVGFFDEVLRNLIAPAGRQAGFTVTTANRQGTEVIHSTIVNDLLDAELVIADLTEHNPNVLFELGMRMAHDKPIALIRAKGTGQIFDVDNMLRVLDYDPNLWPSTVERDLPKLAAHIEATWNNRDHDATYLQLLRRRRVPGPTGQLQPDAS
jgi:hypothetical protein